MPRNEKGLLLANVHLLNGYHASIADFRKLAAEIRETFPQASDDDIQGGKVSKSSFVQGFTIATWSAYLPEGEYPDWYQFPNGKVEYCLL